jgi:hypothetical protein
MTRRLSCWAAALTATLLAAGCATPNTILPMPTTEAFIESCTKSELRPSLDVVGGGQERLRVTRLCDAALGICQRNLESANCQRDLRRYGFGK